MVSSKVTPPQKTPPQQLVVERRRLSTTNHQQPPPPPPPPPTKIILIMKRPRRGRSCDIHTYTTRKSARILLFYYSYFIIYTPFQKARDQCDRARDDSRMDSVFSFFATKKINGEREYVKSAYFPAPSSCERFMRCTGASARFSAPLSRARSPVNARAWMGQGSDDVSSSRAKLVSV